MKWCRWICLVIATLLTGCNLIRDIPGIRDIPAVTNVPPSIIPQTTNSPESDWGAVIKLKRGDPDLAKEEWRTGKNPEVSVLEVNADWWIGKWVGDCVARKELIDGSLELTAQPELYNPETGHHFRFCNFTVAHDNTARIADLTVVVPAKDRGDVTRVRYECREKLR